VRLIDGALPELAWHGGARKQGQDRVDQIKLTQGGTSTDYLTARLKRDRPDLLAKVAAGSCTVRAAAAPPASSSRPTL